MPYIGRPLLAGSYNKLDNITISSTTDTFALTKGTAAFTPATAEQLIVSVNGVTQAPNDAYSVSGSNIIFTENLIFYKLINNCTIMMKVISTKKIDK